MCAVMKQAFEVNAKPRISAGYLNADRQTGSKSDEKPSMFSMLRGVFLIVNPKP